MIDLDLTLHEQIRALGTETYKKFLGSEVIRNWSKLVDDEIAAQVVPVTIEHGVLFVDAQSSAVKDQLKFFAEEIIDAINESFGREEPLVKEIRIAKGFQIADKPPQKISTPAPVEEVDLEQIPLTDEETKHCEEQAQRISNDKLRQTVLQTLLTQARLKKFRLANGWHKCARCETLCPPKETFCEVCRIKERDAMTEELFKIFYDEPWIKTWDAQKILLERMPHMRRECLPDAVESARTSLIQQIASHVRYGDDSSPNALKLVMLEKRLPPDKLTPAIIKRALSDLQFNLAELTKFPRK
ncbi:MAG: DUF721 domain-containing protein [Selenomonadaceae bacterium]|nr:DUF721 domain-containing protein [Selenomonadaceae bacterium]